MARLEGVHCYYDVIFLYFTFFNFRLIEWIFYNVNLEENVDDTKAVFLKGMYELLCSEGGKSPHAPMLPVSLQTSLKRGTGRDGGGKGVLSVASKRVTHEQPVCL